MSFLGFQRTTNPSRRHAGTDRIFLRGKLRPGRHLGHGRPRYLRHLSGVSKMLHLHETQLTRRRRIRVFRRYVFGFKISYIPVLVSEMSQPVLFQVFHTLYLGAIIVYS